MITGAHIIICSKEAEADRAFFREIPNFRMWMWVMAGRYFDFRRPSFAARCTGAATSCPRSE